MQKFFLALCLTLNLQCATQADQETLFQQALAKSQSGLCAEAKDIFLQLPKSFAVCNNLASCFYAQGDLVQAMLYLKRAEKLACPRQRFVIAQKIKVLRRALNQPVSTPQTLRQKIDYYAHLIRYLTLGLNVFWLQILLLLLWILLLLAIKRSCRTWLKTTLLLCNLALFGLILWLHVAQGRQEAVVIADNTELWSGPGTDFLPIISLPKAKVVTIVNEKEQFYCVKQNGKTGWIARDKLELI